MTSSFSLGAYSNESLGELKKLAKQFDAKLANIKVILFDVDGVLTNGLLYFGGGEVGYNRFFNVHDGYGMKLMKANGIKTGIISGGDSVGLRKRAENLDLDYCFVGNEDKRSAILKVVEDGFLFEEILYMGDELFDIPILKKVGFSCCPANARPEVKEIVDYISMRDGGTGCVREVIDLVRYVQNIFPKELEF